MSLHHLGLLRLASAAPRRWPAILYYHRVCDAIPTVDLGLSVTTSNFDAQMLYLASAYDVRPLEELLDRWASGTMTAREVAVTFDDGYRDNYDRAFPILQRYRIPATIFLTTALMGSSRRLWWDRVAVALEAARARGNCWSRGAGGLHAPLVEAVDAFVATGSKRSVLATMDALKTLGREERVAAVEVFERAVGVPPESFAASRLFMTWDEAREMSRAGIDMGSHTETHPVLPELAPGDAARELTGSRARIEQEIGRPAAVLAYPDGCFDESIATAAAAAGYRYAVQTRRNLGVEPGHRYAIPRVKIEDAHSLGPFGGFSASGFAFELSGLANALLLRDRRRNQPYGTGGATGSSVD